MAGRALVLGGGGVVGIAWETGLLKGLRDAGLDPAGADLIVGISAGSVVGTQIRGGRSLDELYAAQFEPDDGATERTMGRDIDSLRAIFGLWGRAEEMTPALCAQIGALAVAARTVSEAERWRSSRSACSPWRIGRPAGLRSPRWTRKPASCASGTDAPASR